MWTAARIGHADVARRLVRSMTALSPSQRAATGDKGGYMVAQEFRMQDAVDQQPMTDMIPYFQNSGAAADGLHNRLSGVFWWAWNSNSGNSLWRPLTAHLPY